jgi:photosystem II stability/assembly factor-like uncharacterized protein
MMRCVRQMLLLSLMLASHLGAHWKWQNPMPHGNMPGGLFVVNSKHLIITDQFETIFETLDGGNSWLVYNGAEEITDDFESRCHSEEQQNWVGNQGYIFHENQDHSSHLKSIQSLFDDVRFCRFLNPMIGWVVAGDSVYATRDGGLSWKAQPSRSITHMYFVNPDLGFACTSDLAVLKTTDGGETWSTLYNHPANFSVQFKNIVFFNEMTGLVFGSEYVSTQNSEFGFALKTTDGGVEWTPSGHFPGSLSYPMPIYFFDDKNGWMGYEETLYQTKDGGTHWTPRGTGYYLDSVEGIAFVGTDTVYVQGISAQAGIILKSTDQGQNWTVMNRPCTENTLTSLCFVDSITGYAGGRDGTLIKTSDGGRSWQAKSVMGTTVYDDLIASISFIDKDTGWFIANKDFNDTTYIYSTNDGGESFSIQRLAGIRGSRVQFLDNKTGFITGISWSTNSGKILKTMNGGTDWIQLLIKPWKDISLHFPSERIGYAIEFGWPKATLLRTGDGGDHWESVELDFGVASGYIFFINDTMGWIGDSAGGIHKTTDGGTTWRNLDYPFSVNSISFADEFFGCVAGMDGYSATTNDGGETWHMEKRITRNTFCSVDFVDSRNGWAVGQNGMILKYVPGESEDSVPVRTPDALDPVRCRMAQNWPNPFNSLTTIHFNIDHPGGIELSILDIKGRQVKLLSNGNVAAGSHQTIWDASDQNGSPVSSGIYLCLMKFGRETNVKKLTLIR